MTHTYWNYDEVPPNQLVYGYRWLNESYIKQPLLKSGAYGAMGGLVTTLEDFSKYVAFHLSATPPSNAKEMGPVKRSSLLEMQHAWNISALNPNYKYPGGRACAIVTAYGYGLRWLKDCDNRIMIGHSGGLPGFGTDWKFMPDYGIGIITFSNHTYAPASLLNMQALDTLIAVANLKPNPIPVSPILNQRKNELLKLLPNWNKAEASGIFAENFFLDYFPDMLRQEATALFTKAGKIIRVQELVALNNLRGSFILEGEKADIEVFFTLTPENPPLIQQYSIREKVKK
jgi:CubicO group peptidase (beta-lactamase class C family)